MTKNAGNGSIATTPKGSNQLQFELAPIYPSDSFGLTPVQRDPIRNKFSRTHPKFNTGKGNFGENSLDCRNEKIYESKDDPFASVNRISMPEVNKQSKYDERFLRKGAGSQSMSKFSMYNTNVSGGGGSSKDNKVKRLNTKCSNEKFVIKPLVAGGQGPRSRYVLNACVNNPFCCWTNYKPCTNNRYVIHERCFIKDL